MGFVMKANRAPGQASLAAKATSQATLALTPTKSSRFIPGLRGIPAGTTTISALSNAFFKPSLPSNAQTVARVLMCDRSAATPGVFFKSCRERVEMWGFCLSRRDSGCPMPPPAPTTATLRPRRQPPRPNWKALRGSLDNWVINRGFNIL